MRSSVAVPDVPLPGVLQRNRFAAGVCELIADAPADDCHQPAFE
jgi:hypothetical protein